MTTSGSVGEAQPVDTHVNVAQLLKQPVGATRRYRLEVPSLPLGEDRTASTIRGDIKLTRIGRGLLVTGTADTTVDLTCARCLEEYTQPVTLELEEEFRPSIDVTSGLSIPYARDEDATEGDFFLIGEDHVLDLTEALRQAVWLGAPMVPRCGDDCPGLTAGMEADDPGEEPEAGATTAGVDARLAVLQHLLDEHDDTTAAEPEPAPDRRRSPAD